MECIPAIDVRDGRCVRLLRGSFDDETVYGDPVAQAREYVDAGATALHVVDLDAARTGRPVNREVVLEIVRAVPVPVQYGGGVRDELAAIAALEAGIGRVVLGTFAVEHPDLACALAEHHPGRIVVGLDHRRVPAGAGATAAATPAPDGAATPAPDGAATPAPDGVHSALGGVRREVAVRGWEQGAGVDLLDALAPFEGAPLAGVVVTDITRDGTLAGPDLEGYALLLGETALPIVASGGIGGAADLADLAALERSGRRLAAAVVGRALLDGRLTVAEAVRACGT